MELNESNLLSGFMNEFGQSGPLAHQKPQHEEPAQAASEDNSDLIEQISLLYDDGPDFEEIRQKL